MSLNSVGRYFSTQGVEIDVDVVGFVDAVAIVAVVVAVVVVVDIIVYFYIFIIASLRGML